MSKLSTCRLLIACVLAIACDSVIAGSIEQEALQADLARITAGFDGRVGIGLEDGSGAVCINGGQRFSLQSVMKLVVRMAVMDDCCTEVELSPS